MTGSVLPPQETQAAGRESGMEGIDDEKRALFEERPVPRAVMQLALPTVLSSLVVALYNLTDTYFVGMLNDPIQNAAVTLAAPVTLAFCAVTNLFGVGCSSVMSRAMGRRSYETARRTSAFGLYCSLACALAFSLAYLAFRRPLLALLGADASTAGTTIAYIRWTVAFGAAPSIFNVVAANWEPQAPVWQPSSPTARPASTSLFFSGGSGTARWSASGLG